MTAEPTTFLDATRRRIEARLRDLLPSDGDDHSLADAISDGALAPGKRLRPLMTVLIAEDLGGSAEAAIEIGCAIELVHAASLILDDLPCMDNADLRRGRPAIHARHGEDVAVLAAVAMLNQAYLICARAPELSAETRLGCVAILSEAIGLDGLVGGQFRDLHDTTGRRGEDEIVEINALKTGALFAAAVEIGCEIGRAGPDAAADLADFASAIGQAFQLLDDLLDVEAGAEQSGKTPGRDAGKATIVSIEGPAAARRLIEAHRSQAHMRLEMVFGSGSRMARLVDAIFEDAYRRLSAGYRIRVPERQAGAV